MISFINSWIQGIVIAVIIASIIDMILPKGSMKKYINVIIGIYILFSIVSPIINNISKENLAQMINVEKYTKQIESSSTKMTQMMETNSSKTIKDIYTSNLETDIKNNIKSKGYDVKRLYIKVRDDENYTIENIEIMLNMPKEIVKQNNKIQIDDVVIGNSKKVEDKKNIDNEKIIEVRDYLADIYHIDKAIIKVE